MRRGNSGLVEASNSFNWAPCSRTTLTRTTTRAPALRRPADGDAGSQGPDANAIADAEVAGEESEEEDDQLGDLVSELPDREAAEALSVDEDLSQAPPQLRPPGRLPGSAATAST